MALYSLQQILPVTLKGENKGISSSLSPVKIQKTEGDIKSSDLLARSLWCVVDSGKTYTMINLKTNSYVVFIGIQLADDRIAKWICRFINN